MLLPIPSQGRPYHNYVLRLATDMSVRCIGGGVISQPKPASGAAASKVSLTNELSS